MITRLGGQTSREKVKSSGALRSYFKPKSRTKRRLVLTLIPLIPYLQRLLNNELLKRKAEFNDLQTSDGIGKRVKIMGNSYLVNYMLADMLIQSLFRK